MVLLAVLFVPQVVEKLLSCLGTVGARVDRRDQTRHRRLEGEILAGVFLHGFLWKRAGRPLRVERVLEQMLFVDHRVDAIQKLHASLLLRLMSSTESTAG